MDRQVPSPNARRPASAPETEERVDGILNLRKPFGATSMDVVRQVKRLTRQRHVGHGGTLDPLAEGVLAICFGRATRLMDYLVDALKVYRATIHLGITTDTYDAQGSVVATHEIASVTRQMIEEAFESFRGVVYQVPPMYSALKHQGQRLYDLARSGVEVERAPRKVQVHRLELVHWESPRITVEIECGRGLYIRSLAHDLGVALGCGSHLEALTRLRSGPLAVEEGVTLEAFGEMAEQGRWREALHAPDLVLQHLDAVVVGRGVERSIRQGRLVPLGPGRRYPPPVDPCRIYSVDGRFLGLVRYDFVKGSWKPDKVLDAQPVAVEEL